MLRYSRRLPIGKFFTYSSWLMAVLTVVLAGKGIAALQEAGIVSIAPLRSVPRISLVGLFPTGQTVAAQLLMIAGSGRRLRPQSSEGRHRVVASWQSIAPVVVATVTPIKEGYFVSEFGSDPQNVMATPNIKAVIDVNAPLSGANFTTDGVHLNPAGYAFWPRSNGFDERRPRAGARADAQGWPLQLDGEVERAELHSSSCCREGSALKSAMPSTPRITASRSVTDYWWRFLSAASMTDS
jgi:hypothetical protein